MMGLLEEQKFKKDNVYGRHSFEGTPAFRGWWGVEDRYVFELFENKISNLDFSKPFFAVMFTIDLHGACGAEENPAFVSFDDVQKSTIKNLNNFIAWFKKQPFYANTTLVVAGDHRRMGGQQNAGRELFNAFYNLPEDLKSEYDNTRRFNHIDMCPTLMEIAGVNLPKRKYGLGVSIF